MTWYRWQGAVGLGTEGQSRTGPVAVEGGFLCQPHVSSQAENVRLHPEVLSTFVRGLPSMSLFPFSSFVSLNSTWRGA